MSAARREGTREAVGAPSSAARVKAPGEAGGVRMGDCPKRARSLTTSLASSVFNSTRVRTVCPTRRAKQGALASMPNARQADLPRWRGPTPASTARQRWPPPRQQSATMLPRGPLPQRKPLQEVDEEGEGGGGGWVGGRWRQSKVVRCSDQPRTQHSASGPLAGVFPERKGIMVSVREVRVWSNAVDRQHARRSGEDQAYGGTVLGQSHFSVLGPSCTWVGTHRRGKGSERE